MRFRDFLRLMIVTDDIGRHGLVCNLENTNLRTVLSHELDNYLLRSVILYLLGTIGVLCLSMLVVRYGVHVQSIVQSIIVLFFIIYGAITGGSHTLFRDYNNILKRHNVETKAVHGRRGATVEIVLSSFSKTKTGYTPVIICTDGFLEWVEVNE